LGACTGFSANTRVLDSVAICFLIAASKFSGNGFFLTDARTSSDCKWPSFKKYFSGAEVAKTCDKVDTATALGCSKIFCIEYSPRNAVPEFIQLFEENPEIFAFMAVKQTGDIFDNDPTGFSSGNECCILKGEFVS
jgi:hypothetical protein